MKVPQTVSLYAATLAALAVLMFSPEGTTVDYSELKSRASARNLKVEVNGAGPGHFKDLAVGTGADLVQLVELRDELRAAGLQGGVKLDYVNVREHPQHGQRFLSIESFWAE